MTRGHAPACEPYRHDLGAYVVGGLAPEEVQALEEHLASCGSCQEEHHELATLPPLLDLAREPGPQVPARVRDRVVAAAARRQGRRRGAMATAAAALVAALAGVAVGLLVSPAPDPIIAVPLESVEPFEDATGWARLHPEEDRLVVALDVQGLAPVTEPEVYEAWLYTGDERIVSIGQLELDDGQVRAELVAHGDLDDYRGFWITVEPDKRDPAHEGQTVLRASLPDRP
jgi:hypothetical protein